MCFYCCCCKLDDLLEIKTAFFFYSLVVSSLKCLNPTNTELFFFSVSKLNIECKACIMHVTLEVTVCLLRSVGENSTNHPQAWP